MVDFKKLIEKHDSMTPEEREQEKERIHKEMEKRTEEYLKHETLRFEDWVKRYDLIVNFQNFTLTTTRKITDWNDFYLKAFDYGFKYVGNRSLIMRTDNPDLSENWIKRLKEMRETQYFLWSSVSKLPWWVCIYNIVFLCVLFKK